VQRQSHLEFGLIHHALCAAIRSILRDYLELVAQLEHLFNTDPAFTLQRLWLHVHPTLHQLSLVHALTSELLWTPEAAAVASSSDDDDLGPSSSDDDEYAGPGAEGLKAVLGEMKAAKGGGTGAAVDWAAGGPVKGGEVLAVIEERLERMSGDPRAVQLYSSLFQRAAQPYARILLGWISTGHLADPHGEFLIRENASVTQALLDADYIDEYWQRRYTLRDPAATSAPTRAESRDRGVGGGAVVPRCLEAWKTKVLLAGKYLNVVRECGIDMRTDAGVVAEDEVIDMNDEACVAADLRVD